MAIAEAQPGDVLEVRIQKIAIDVPWACNSFGAGRGFLPDDFPYARTKIIPLDREKMLAEFAPGVEIPLHPFFGSMGIAHAGGQDRLRSAVDERGQYGQQGAGRRDDAVYPGELAPGRTLRWATAMPGRVTARWTLRRWRRS